MGYFIFKIDFLLTIGKVTVYLGRRDFIDHLDSIDPIDGIIVVENDYLQGRKVYGQVRNKIIYFNIENHIFIHILYFILILGNNNFSLWTRRR